MTSFADRIFLLLLLVLVSTVAAQGQQPAGTLRFINETDATLRLEFVAGSSIDHALPDIEPRQQVDIAVAPGQLVLDLVSFKTVPPRSHRVAIEVDSEAETFLRFNAARVGLYLLEDEGNLASIPVLPSAVQHPTSDAKDTGPLPRDPAVACQPPLNDWNGVVLWKSDEIGQHNARYYRRNGGFLCGIDGDNVFHIGAEYRHFICSPMWTNCTRHEPGDFLALPMVYTSEIFDEAMEIARRVDTDAVYVNTQTITGFDDPTRIGHMTAYTSYGRVQTRPKCPQGYRPHYQGSCINVADELADHPEKGVRMVDPLR